MTKIPVGATIAHAYRFAFGNFLALLSIVWLPWLIMAAGGFLLMRQATAFSVAIATHDFSKTGSTIGLLAPFYIVMVILIFMQILGVTEQALGLRRGSPYYYLSLGKPLWRLIAAFLLTVALILCAYVALIVLGVLLGLLVKLAHLSGASAAIAATVLVVSVIAGFCAYVYALVRLAFLLIPVIVAEQRIGLARSWQLGRGNFWRMLVIWLSIIVPAFALELVFLFGFLFHGLPPMMPPHATPDQAAAVQSAMAAWNAEMMSRMTGYWYITYPLFAVFTILFYGVSAGAQSFAYRARTTDEPVVL